MRFAPQILTPVFLLALTACAPEAPVKAGAALACPASGVAVSDGWIRAIRPGQKMSAAYMTVCAAEDDQLIGASLDGISAAELHISAMSQDNVATMAPAEGGVALSAGAPVMLAPGGAHIMLIGVERDLHAGDQAVVTLHFEKAGAREFSFDIRDPLAAGAH